MPRTSAASASISPVVSGNGNPHACCWDAAMWAVSRSTGQPAASASARHPGRSWSTPVCRFSARLARAAIPRAR